MYHKHFPERFWTKHPVSRKHTAKNNEFKNFEEWKKTNPRFRNIELKIPKSILIKPTNKSPIEELLEKFESDEE
jgi:hypothetical protein